LTSRSVAKALSFSAADKAAPAQRMDQRAMAKKALAHRFMMGMEVDAWLS
jgi:hypothetical protein